MIFEVIAWIGFAREKIETKYTLKKMIGLAASASFSTKPLRLAIVFGVLSAGLALLILIYSIYMRIVVHSAGWLL